MMIKLIIFDLWDTLAFNQNGFGSYIQKIIDVIGEENREKFLELRREWYLVNIPEDKFFSRLLSQCNKPSSLSDHLISIWNSQLEHCRLYPDSLYIINKLKSFNIKLVLVSNSVPIGKKAAEILGLNNVFDQIIFSFDDGLAKPSPMIYKKILDKFHCEPHEVLAVGDKLDTDIRGAEGYGIKAVLIDRHNKLEYRNKIAELDELEFYLK